MGNGQGRIRGVGEKLIEAGEKIRALLQMRNVVFDAPVRAKSREIGLRCKASEV
jgi:hypothetical protein